MRADLLHMDRQTDRHEASYSRFSEFCEKRPRNKTYHLWTITDFLFHTKACGRIQSVVTHKKCNMKLWVRGLGSPQRHVDTL